MIDGPEVLAPNTWRGDLESKPRLRATYRYVQSISGPNWITALATFRDAPLPEVWTIRSVALKDPAENDGHARDRRDGNLE